MDTGEKENREEGGGENVKREVEKEVEGGGGAVSR